MTLDKAPNLSELFFICETGIRVALASWCCEKVHGKYSDGAGHIIIISQVENYYFLEMKLFEALRSESPKCSG